VLYHPIEQQAEKDENYGPYPEVTAFLLRGRRVYGMGLSGRYV
jgi:hypothetical protein